MRARVVARVGCDIPIFTRKSSSYRAILFIAIRNMAPGRRARPIGLSEVHHWQTYESKGGERSCSKHSYGRCVKGDLASLLRKRTEPSSSANQKVDSLTLRQLPGIGIRRLRCGYPILGHAG